MQVQHRDARLVGCPHCRAVVPLEARFCRRCGQGLGHVRPRAETADERRARIEREVEAGIDRVNPSHALGGLALALWFAAGICFAFGGDAVGFGVLFVVSGCGALVQYLWRQARIREAVERRVREGQERRARR